MQQQAYDVESANLFSLIAHQALLLLDTEGTIQLGSRGALTLLAVERHAVLGMSLDSLLPLRPGHNDQAAGVALILERAREAAEQEASFQYRTERDGVWLDVEVEHLAKCKSRPERFVVSIDDVTEARQAQAQLQDSLRMLNEAEEKAGLGHWRLMLDSQAIIWSRGVYHIHGFEEGCDISLDKVLEAYLPEDRQRINQLLADSVARKEGQAFKASIRRPDGVLRAVDVQWNVELDEAEQPISVFGVIHDCTAEHAATRQLIVARDEALAEAHANKMLLATMSHEIRTPLAGIIGMLDALLAENIRISTAAEQAQVLQRLRTINNASKALMDTLNDVLDHTKIESGNFQLDDFEFDLSDVINGTADLFQASVLDKQLRLERDVMAPAGVVGDPKRIQQIVANFLSNAIKFTQRGFVKVSLGEVADGQLLIEVRDSGVGIAELDQQKLFTPFQQADDSIYGRFGGTGLGLSICRSLVEAMQGSLGVSSEPGAGSCFWARLPLRRVVLESAQDKVSVDQPVLPHLDSRPPHLLIVDDNKTNVLIAEGMLRAIGGTCEEADNGLNALETLLSSTFDAVLLDSSMPVMGGVRCLELIRQLPEPLCHIPVVAYTAHREADVSAAYLAATFDAILEKPLSRDQLFTTLNQLFSQQAYRPAAPNELLSEEVYGVLNAMAEAFEQDDQEVAIMYLGKLSRMAQRDSDVRIHTLCGFLSECVAALNVSQVSGLLRAMSRHQGLESDISRSVGESRQ